MSPWLHIIVVILFCINPLPLRGEGFAEFSAVPQGIVALAAGGGLVLSSPAVAVISGASVVAAGVYLLVESIQNNRRSPKPPNNNPNNNFSPNKKNKNKSRTKKAAQPNKKKTNSQVSHSTIETSVQWNSHTNKIRHIFQKTEHNLKPLVEKLGGEIATIRAIIEALAKNKLLPTTGIFKDIPITISAYTVYVRGIVQDGVIKIGTMFIP